MNPALKRSRLAPLAVLGLVTVLAGATGAFSLPDQAVARQQGADKAFAKAQALLARGDAENAITLIESAVAANPRDPAYRALLGQAYLRAGRFASAATALNDAMTLGENSSRTALALALAEIGAGRGGEAITILTDWREAVPAADLGLAFALAGDTRAGVQILTDAIRGGDNSAKVRQNLAYAYVLDGQWADARMMMMQDVPADQIDARMQTWARQALSDSAQARVAALLKAPLRSDPGQPAALALGNAPSQPQLAAAPVMGELPPGNDDSAAVLASAPPPVAANPPSAPVPLVAAGGVRMVSNPVVQSLPATYTPRIAAAPQRASAPVKLARAVVPAAVSPAKPAHPATAPAGSTHRVQLGAFGSEQSARKAWAALTASNPELGRYQMAISQAQVKGKTYWRLAATGMGSAGATSLCAQVRTRGGACFAYAAPASQTARLASAR